MIIIVPRVAPGWESIGIVTIYIYIPVPVIEINHVVI
jgi:hypothetical protein